MVDEKITEIKSTVQENKESAETPKAESEKKPAETKEEISPPVQEKSFEERKALERLENWKPRTSLGKSVMNLEITNIEEILSSGKQIREPEIVDKLIPNIKNEIILIGGRKGKGGGRQRIPIKTNATVTKSGRRFTMNAFAVVGNGDGIIGIGKGSSPESRYAVNKSINKAKLNLLVVNRGCGSWECGCDIGHSIPYKTKGKTGSVKVELLPAPKGVGLVCGDEIKKVFRLAGVKDIWVKSYGNTGMRINFVSAVFDALKNLNIYKR